MYEIQSDLHIEDSQILNLFELAKADMNAGRYDEAINFFNSILGLNPKLANVWFQKGIAIFKSSTLGYCRFLESKTYFEKAISLSDNEQTRRIISEAIVELAEIYFPAYEEFFMDHYRAPSSVVSLFNTYYEFDQMIFWATEICPDNSKAYETGWNLCREIIEMPKEYVKNLKSFAGAQELMGKAFGKYGREYAVSGEIEREIAEEVLENLETYSQQALTYAYKYEKGIKGIPELKELIKHYSTLVVEKPNFSSEGKSFEDWVVDEKNSNKVMVIIGIVLEGIFIYNWSGNDWSFTFWSIVWCVIGLIFILIAAFNKPTEEKYNQQQTELANWVKKSHRYIRKHKVTKKSITKLKGASKYIFQSYYYFNPEKGKEKDPETMALKIEELFFKSSSPFNVSANE